MSKFNIFFKFDQMLKNISSFQISIISEIVTLLKIRFVGTSCRKLVNNIQNELSLFTIFVYTFSSRNRLYFMNLSNLAELAKNIHFYMILDISWIIVQLHSSKYRTIQFKSFFCFVETQIYYQMVIVK